MSIVNKHQILLDSEQPVTEIIDAEALLAKSELSKMIKREAVSSLARKYDSSWMLRLITGDKLLMEGMDGLRSLGISQAASSLAAALELHSSASYPTVDRLSLINDLAGTCLSASIGRSRISELVIMFLEVSTHRPSFYEAIEQSFYYSQGSFIQNLVHSIYDISFPKKDSKTQPTSFPLQGELRSINDSFTPLIDEVDEVSGEIDQDSNKAIRAAYNRSTVISLAMAVILGERFFPKVSIEPSGDHLDPNSLFACSEDPTSHQAIYDGYNVRVLKDSGGTQKISLLDWLDELRQGNHLSDEEWDELETEARRVEIFTRENIARTIHTSILLQVKIGIKNIRGEQVHADEYRKIVLHSMNGGLQDQFHRPNLGRRVGTGMFRNADEFRVALQDVLGTFSKKPSQSQLMIRLRKHPLCQRKKSKASLADQTKTLRDWLKRSKFKNLQEAWDKYQRTVKNGK